MPDYSTLTPEEINRLCAERVGREPQFSVTDGPFETHSGQEYFVTSRTVAPDYCRDRNALVELWDTIDRWEVNLPFIVLLRAESGAVDSDFALVRATPRQHCEAFLMATEGQR